MRAVAAVNQLGEQGNERPAPRKGLGIVVTGATKGFGFALAMELLSLGDRVVICGRDDERTQTAVAALQAAYPGMRPIQT